MDLKSLASPFKVGLVVLVAIVATLYMVTVLTRGDSLMSRGGYTVHAQFEDVTGLAKDSRVRMSGISVGYIESIRLEGTKARVDIRMTKDIELHKGVEETKGYWKNGATVEKTQSSFIGDYFLEITPGKEGPVLGDGDQIMNVTSAVGPSELFSRFDRIATDIERITSSVSGVVGGEDGEQRLEKMVKDTEKIVSTLRRFTEENSGKIDKLLTNARMISSDMRRLTDEGGRSLQKALADAEAVMEEVRYIVGESSGDVQEGLGTLRGTLARLQTTLDSLNYSLQNVQDITDKVNQGEGSIGQLLNDPTVVRRTERILGDVESFTDRVDKLKAIVNARSEYHLRHQTFKNVLGLTLQPEPLKWYRVQFVDAYRGTTTVTREDINTTNADAEDGQFRRTTVTTRDEFKLSLEMARGIELADWLQVTGRFGLIESSGGMGADVGLFNNQQVEISTDVFDFGLDRNPRLRSFATWNFLKHAYVHGGIDDALNRDRRDFFLGAGIRFNDQDLKALLTTTGVPAQ
jgi:phospholipid/cholesterol/gamma-HCH transport system substrate-binding protein